MRNHWYDNCKDIGSAGVSTLGQSAGQVPVQEGEIDSVLSRLHGLLQRAQSVAGQLEETSTRLMGATTTGIGKNELGQPNPVSTIGKLHEVCGWLEASIERIGEAAQRLSRL